MNSTIEEVMYEVWNGKNIAIAGHTNPDGDAIGSSMAMALSIHKMGKKPLVLLEEFSDKFSMIPGGEFIYKGNYQDIEPDVFIALDTASKDRLGKAAEVFDRCKITVNIDHHISNDGFAKYNYIDSAFSSTSEVLFDFISRFVPFDKDIALALFAGIVFDTGGFRHGSTGIKTHLAVAKLMEYNIPFTDVFNEMMYRHTYQEAKAFAAAVGTLRFMDGYPATYGYITIEMLDKVGATYKDLDGVVEYILNTKGSQVAVFAYEKAENETKISFRSQEMDVNQIAGIFGGGGHIRAAGCTIMKSADEALLLVLEEVRKAFGKNV